MRLPLEIRRAAAALAGTVPVRIRSGPNRGCRWTLTSAGRGIWRGRFEPARVAIVEAMIQRGDVVWDIGAHKGYITLLAARRVGAHGRVLACEPAAANHTALLRHLEWNRITNVDVEHGAVSDYDGVGRIGGRGSTIAFRLGSGPEEVPVHTLQSLAHRYRKPDVLKIDVEGEEANVLRGAGHVLRDVAAAIVSIHSPAALVACIPLLEASGLRVLPSQPLREWRGGKWRGDPDVLAVGNRRDVDAEALAAF